MARLNLTIPDPLYARLERLRDRVNVSKVCAIALEKELNMLEGQMTTAAADPRLQRLIQRLQRQQSNRDRWYQRGREDGENWAIDVAGLEELREASDEWEEEDDDYEDQEDELPETFSLWESVRRWLLVDMEEAGIRSRNLDSARIRGSFAEAFGFALRLAQEESTSHEKAEAVRRLFEEFEKHAYLNGWYSAVRDIWKAVAPALRSSDD